MELLQIRRIVCLPLIIFALAYACRDARDVYLFSSFHEPATEGLRLLYSYDGYNWTDMGHTFLKPEVGKQKVMRDPSLIRGPDGIFHLVWTTSWRDDPGFGYSSSPDLVQWSGQKFIPLMAYDTSTINVWAPELFYDEEAGEFIIIWASTVPFRFDKGIEEEENNHRMYYTVTKDFCTFSPARLFFDPGFSIIDATIVRRKSDDDVLVFKDNTRPNRNLKVAFSGSPSGPWTDISGAFTGFLTEGPAVIRPGKDWIIYYDAYGENRFGAVKTRDFKIFTDISGEISMPEGTKHGTMISVRRSVLDHILENINP
jgi:hypothetical protein